MKLKNFIYLTLSALLLLSSCRMIQKPISSTKAANNKTYEVEYLFEHDGCKVYRFSDNGNWVYFTNCNNTASSYVKDSTGVKVVSNKIILNKRE